MRVEVLDGIERGVGGRWMVSVMVAPPAISAADPG
jgi:hypothetical protein